MDGSAIIMHGCCAHAGMPVMPHGTHLHPARVPACLAGARSTPDQLVHAVSCRAPTPSMRPGDSTVLVLVHVRDYACHNCDSCSWTQSTHTNACGTLYGQYTRLRGLLSAVPLIRISSPL